MRYSRNEVLKEIREKGQETLRNKTVVIVGVGAIGTVSSELLARMGVNLILIDKDEIEESNLGRQTLFTWKDVGKSKVKVAKEKLLEINNEIRIRTIDKTLSKDNLDILKGDLILDCTDNMATRFLINEYCVKNKIPWIHAAAIKTKGVLFNVIPGKACFSCVYPKGKDIESCEDVGVLNTVTSNIASLQVTEAVKILLNKKIENKLMRLDLWKNTFDKIEVKRNSNCKVCDGNGINNDFSIKLCKTKASYSVKPIKNLKLDLSKIKKKFNVTIETPILLVIKEDNEEIIIHDFGEIVFKTLKDEDKIRDIAMRIYKER